MNVCGKQDIPLLSTFGQGGVADWNLLATFSSSSELHFKIIIWQTKLLRLEPQNPDPGGYFLFLEMLNLIHLVKFLEQCGRCILQFLCQCFRRIS